MNWYKTASLDAQWIHAFTMAFSMVDQSFGHFQPVRSSSRPGGQVFDLVFSNLREMNQNTNPPCTVRLEINVPKEIVRYQVQMGNKLLDADSLSTGSELIPQVASKIVNSAMMALKAFKANTPTGQNPTQNKTV